jgi:hypothetical protein
MRMQEQFTGGEVVSYCLMCNYFHRLLEVPPMAAIHQRFTCRMQDLGEFMTGVLQRLTQWFNRAHSRTGRWWEDRFKSVIVEDGVAAKTISAYIDPNPVRGGMVRALRAHQGVRADAGL